MDDIALPSDNVAVDQTKERNISFRVSIKRLLESWRECDLIWCHDGVLLSFTASNALQVHNIDFIRGGISLALDGNIWRE